MPPHELFSCLERRDAHVKKMEFSKKLLIADDAILALMVAAFFVFNLNGHDTGNCSIVVSAWIAQVAIGTGAYDWKAKAENLVKLPLLLLAELPKDMRERAKLVPTKTTAAGDAHPPLSKCRFYGQPAANSSVLTSAKPGSEMTVRRVLEQI